MSQAGEPAPVKSLGLGEQRPVHLQGVGARSTFEPAGRVRQRHGLGMEHTWARLPSSYFTHGETRGSERSSLLHQVTQQESRQLAEPPAPCGLGYCSRSA